MRVDVSHVADVSKSSKSHDVLVIIDALSAVTKPRQQTAHAFHNQSEELLLPFKSGSTG